MGGWDWRHSYPIHEPPTPIQSSFIPPSHHPRPTPYKARLCGGGARGSATHHLCGHPVIPRAKPRGRPAWGQERSSRSAASCGVLQCNGQPENTSALYPRAAAVNCPTGNDHSTQSHVHRAWHCPWSICSLCAAQSYVWSHRCPPRGGDQGAASGWLIALADAHTIYCRGMRRDLSAGAAIRDTAPGS